MSLVGILGEYNPFHRGHEYLIKSAKTMSSADLLVSVMSGDFTQRGTPAVFDKWKRAEAAVKGGINLVLELPQVHAVSHAEAKDSSCHGCMPELLPTIPMNH